MVNKKLIIDYAEYESQEELCEADRELLDAALKAAGSAYAPYSHFQVGAAIRMGNGQIVTGSNQENSAYPSGLCAERTAMFYASASYPDLRMESIAITAVFEGQQCEVPTYPCGACRQVMADYQKKGGAPLRILLGSRTVTQIMPCVEAVMPFVFDNLPE